MIKIISKELEIDKDLKNKIEFICKFCNTTPTLFNGNIRNIERTNLSYTDNLRQVRCVVKNFSDVSVEYHDTKREIPLLLHLRTSNGEVISKYNPDYVEYLKRKFPEMSEDEVYCYMSQKLKR